MKLNVHPEHHLIMNYSHFLLSSVVGSGGGVGGIPFGLFIV